LKPITCKFGGTSLADEAAMANAAAIVLADERRRFIVPSAPGKRHENDTKVTDHFYDWHQRLISGEDLSPVRDAILERFREMGSALGVDLDFGAELERIAHEAQDYDTPDYLASRGEYLNGRLLAVLLDAEFLAPETCIRFDTEGKLDPETFALLAAALPKEGRCVIPGFYGADPDGRIRTFSRGGSDITGALLARAGACALYENWTDVSGMLMADPGIIPEPHRIAEITYQELRELAYMGARVFHDEAIFPVKEAGIPIAIRNTQDPEAPGTTILPEREALETVCGIAGRKGFSMIQIEKTLMNRERGFLRRLLGVLDQHDVGVEHLATGIDALSFVIPDEDLDGQRERVCDAIREACKPDSFSLRSGLAIIATVGQGMQGKIGMAARLCQALACAGISIHVIDQGSPENNIIVGVDEEAFEEGIRAIYNEFYPMALENLGAAEVEGVEAPESAVA